MGSEQPRRSVLSKRRSMRRLLLVSFCRMIAFTRNPSVHSVSDKADTYLNTGKAGGFRASQNLPAKTLEGFACLRPSQISSRAEGYPLTDAVVVGSSKNPIVAMSHTEIH